MKVSTKPNQFTVTKVVKGSDETVSNSDVLQDDDELVVSLVADSDYVIDFMLLYTSSAVADLKLRGVFSNSDMQYGMVAAYAGTGLATGVLAWQTGMGSATSTDGVGGNGATVMSVAGRFHVHTVSAITLTIQWAQNTAEVSNTIVKAGSYLHAMRL